MALSRTPVAARCVLVVTALVVVALASGRPAAVALAVPFAVGPAITGLLRRRVAPATPVPTATPIRLTASIELSADADAGAGADPAQRRAMQGDLVEARIRVDSSVDLDAVRLVLALDGFSTGQTLDWTIALRAGRPYVMTFSARAERWGRRRIGPLSVTAWNAGLLARLPEVVAAPAEVVVYPQAPHVEAGTDAPAALAYTGEHPSMRAGPGMELDAVRPFQPGDGLRRVNWKATLRSGQLHSTTRLSDRSASLLVLVDCRHEVGQPGGSSLDVSGEVALAVCEHFLAIGDVVAVMARGRVTRLLPPGTGRRQLARVREWLLDLGSVAPPGMPAPEASSVAAAMVRAWAWVIAISPLLDENDAIELASLRRRGAGVLAIDVLDEAMLPQRGEQRKRRGRSERPDPTPDVARRLWLLERQMLLEQLGDLGVPIVRWSEEQSLGAALRDLARLAAAPRMVAR